MFWPVPVVFFVVLIVLILLLSRNLDAGVSSRSGSYIHDNYHTTEVTTDGEQQRGYRLVVAAFTPTLVVARSKRQQQRQYQHHQLYHSFNPKHRQHRYSRKDDDDVEEDEDIDSSVLDADTKDPDSNDKVEYVASVRGGAEYS